jgi:PDZ domain-containing protein
MKMTPVETTTPELDQLRHSADLGEASRFPRWPFWTLALSPVLVALVIVGWTINLPYYALSPGPTEETGDLIDVEGSEIYMLNGDLIMLTVSLQEVNTFEYALGWLDESVDLVDREVIRPSNVSPDEHRQANRESMDDSKNTAISVALLYLGYPVTDAGEGVLVTSVVEGTPADGVLEVGDVIIEVDGIAVFIQTDGVAAITANEIGDTIPLTVDRGGEILDLEVTLIEHTQLPGTPMVGFIPDTYNRRIDLPFEVVIDSANIGGPSAGMVYTLTIIDLLTAEDLLKGNIIAATGTISSDGSVGGIGGIRQKVVAAQAAGAKYIIVPQSNFADALAIKADDVEVFAVANIDEAVEVLRSLPAA